MKLNRILVGSALALLTAGLFVRNELNSTAQFNADMQANAVADVKRATAGTAASPTEPPLPSPQKAPAHVTDFQQWLAGWPDSARTPTDLQQGRQLAMARKERMLRLFESDPAKAMAESLSWSEWRELPQELQDFVEKPFSARVDFVVLPNCPPGGARIHPHQVRLDGELHDAYVFGRRLTMISKEAMPARGILLDGKIVLDDRAVEELSVDDQSAVSDLFAPRGGANVSSISGNRLGAGRQVALVGGELFHFGSEAEVRSLNEVFAAAGQSLSPQSFAVAMTIATNSGAGTIAFDTNAAKDGVLRASSTWTETPRNTLAVRINFSNASAYSYTLTELTNLMRNASNAVKVMSYGKTWLVPRITSVTLPKTREAYETEGPGLIVEDTRTALTAAGINPSSYHFIIHAHPGMNFGYAGLGEVGGGNSWLNGNVSLEVTVHELGHNYGLGHAHFWSGITGMGSLGRNQADGTQVEIEEYGDTFDIMGGSSLPAGHYNAHGKAALNWIEQKEVINVVTNGIYRVYRYDHQSARTNTGTKLALKVSAPSGETYWVSHRKLFTSTPSLVRGANIARADGPSDQSLIDTTPFSRASTAFSNDRSDAGLAVGKTFSDPLETVRITTIASSGVAPLEYIDVQVVFLNGGAFSLFSASDLSTNGLVGTYINRSLRTRPTQDDWRAAAGVTVAGQRLDQSLNFPSDGWGARGPLRLTSGTDANWENFSVQWDGFIVVRRPVILATTSDDSSRFWVDIDGDGVFGTGSPEFVNNNWGAGQGPTRSDLSPVIQPGTYAIRIQYEEGNGGNYFTFGGADNPFELFADEEATTPGLAGSYVGRSLRTATAQADWRVTQPITGTRNDIYPAFTANSWGSLGEVGLSEGANGVDSDWDNFSVQWDGYLKVSAPIRVGTISDDHSRMWIDLNTNGTFAATAPEFINNGWGGAGQGMTLGQLSQVIQPGLYAIRIQYEEGGGGNGFLLGGVPQPPVEAPSLLNNTIFGGTDVQTTPRRIAGDLTIQFWLQSSQVAGGESDWKQGMGLVDASGSDPGFGVSLGNGKILFGVGGASSVTTLQSEFVADGLWHHVSARRVQADGEITLFVDGLKVGRGTGVTNLLDGLADLTIGGLSGGTGMFSGVIDQLKIWERARSDEQLVSDYNVARNTHGFSDEAPAVMVNRTGASVQVFWDPLSGYRLLEGATQADGTYLPLGTDQNSTNIAFGSEPIRFFRVKK